MRFSTFMYPSDKKLIFKLVTRIRTRDYTVVGTMKDRSFLMADPVGWQAHHAQAQAPASLQSFMTTAGSPNYAAVARAPRRALP